MYVKGSLMLAVQFWLESGKICKIYDIQCSPFGPQREKTCFLGL